MPNPVEQLQKVMTQTLLFLFKTCYSNVELFWKSSSSLATPPQIYKKLIEEKSFIIVKISYSFVLLVIYLLHNM